MDLCFPSDEDIGHLLMSLLVFVYLFLEECLCTSFACWLIELIFPLWHCKSLLFWIRVPYLM